MYIVHVYSRFAQFSCSHFFNSADLLLHVHVYIYIYPACSPGARSAASIILRGANDFMVDEMERSVHDALCVVKRVLESQLVVAGGGAVEAALSIFLENLATSIVSQCSLEPHCH